MARGPRASWRERFHRLYPEREVIFRSRGKVRYVAMSARVQAALTAVALAGLTWVVVASVGLFLERDVIAARNAEIAELQTQYAVMAEDLEATRQEFEAKTLEFEVKHRHLVAAVAQKEALEEGLGDALRERDEALGERDEAREEGATLARRLGRLESDLRSAANATANSATSLAYARASLDATSGDRDRALDARARIEDRSDLLETRLSELRDSQVELLARIYERAESNIAALETTLALTGLDVQGLIQESQTDRVGMGGPLAGFDARSPTVAPEFGQGYETAVARLEGHLERWEDLKYVLRRVPLAAPTDSYYISSGFGKAQGSPHQALGHALRHRFFEYLPDPGAQHRGRHRHLQQPQRTLRPDGRDRPRAGPEDALRSFAQIVGPNRRRGGVSPRDRPDGEHREKHWLTRSLRDSLGRRPPGRRELLESGETCFQKMSARMAAARRRQTARYRRSSATI